MKNNLFILCLVSLFFSFQTSLWAQPIFQFKEEIFDFGVVEEGTQVAHSFEFTNVGDEPLTILRVNTTCGCTTPEWTKEAIAPGEQGKIDIVFDSTGRPGKTVRPVYIQSNAKQQEGKPGARYELELVGEVASK